MKRRTRNRLILGHVKRISDREKKMWSEQYGIPKRNIMTLDEIAPKWQRSGQRIVDRLSREAGIEPPKVVVKDVNMALNGVMMGHYNFNNKTITVDKTLVAHGMVSGKKCPPHLHVLLHEFRHHIQFTKNDKRLYEDVGRSWGEHAVEQDAERFANRNCKKESWGWND